MARSRKFSFQNTRINVPLTEGVAVTGLLATASAATIRIPATGVLNADMARGATIEAAQSRLRVPASAWVEGKAGVSRGGKASDK